MIKVLSCSNNPGGIYMIQAGNKKQRTRYETSSQLKVRTLEQCYWYKSNKGILFKFFAHQLI